eukprot:1886684-Pyramimonas_sp.AAC.1
MDPANTLAARVSELHRPTASAPLPGRSFAHQTRRPGSRHAGARGWPKLPRRAKRAWNVPWGPWASRG